MFCIIYIKYFFNNYWKISIAISDELSNSLKEIKKDLENGFKIKLNEDYFSDIDYLSDIIVAIYFNFFITILSNIFIACLFKLWLDSRRRPNIYNELIRQS